MATPGAKMSDETQEQVTCSDCQARVDVTALEHHVKAEHLDYFPFSCGHCRIQFPSEAAAERHALRRRHLPLLVRESDDAAKETALRAILQASLSPSPGLDRPTAKSLPKPLPPPKPPLPALYQSGLSPKLPAAEKPEWTKPVWVETESGSGGVTLPILPQVREVAEEEVGQAEVSPPVSLVEEGSPAVVPSWLSRVTDEVEDSERPPMEQLFAQCRFLEPGATTAIVGARTSERSGRSYRRFLCLECGARILNAKVSEHVYTVHVELEDLLRCGYCPYQRRFGLRRMRQHQAQAHRELPELIFDRRPEAQVAKAYVRWRWRCFPEVSAADDARLHTAPVASFSSLAPPPRTRSHCRLSPPSETRPETPAQPPAKRPRSQSPQALAVQSSLFKTEAAIGCGLCREAVQPTAAADHVWEHLEGQGTPRLLCAQDACAFATARRESLERHQKEAHGGGQSQLIDRSGELQSLYLGQYLACYSSHSGQSSTSN